MKFDKEEFNAELDTAFKDEKSAQIFLENCKKAHYQVKILLPKPGSKKPIAAIYNFFIATRSRP